MKPISFAALRVRGRYTRLVEHYELKTKFTSGREGPIIDRQEFKETTSSGYKKLVSIYPDGPNGTIANIRIDYLKLDGSLHRAVWFSCDSKSGELVRRMEKPINPKKSISQKFTLVGNKGYEKTTSLHKNTWYNPGE